MNINKLEKWYLEHHRKLPFRETSDPYKIWVSEIMLQQTQVDTVVPYYHAFINQYPTVDSLANTNQQTLLRAVEGLGYYRRFINMHKAAKQIIEQMKGHFPDDYHNVKALHGVGQYTAGAIMSIAYNKPYAATDGNVIRVLSRVFAITEDMRQDKHRLIIHQINQANIEKARPRIYTQAIMELGALICKPTSPACEQCPINEDCLAYKNNLVETLPYMTKKIPQKTQKLMTLILRKNNGVFLRQRTERLLHGMYEYPQFERQDIDQLRQALSQQGIKLDQVVFLKTYRHVFTHRIWEMDVYQADVISGAAEDWELCDLKKINHIPMAVAHRQIVIQD